ncbi:MULTISPECIES: hypothetical protein [unclassified Streptomyces]|uniref:hypothetical protein n=1 Tax=unclassified Streptomyces TaxID=2593676 RepID=UPI0006F89F4F|nr:MULTISPECIES: hypothetical protein [unclassified Streptomyces]KQX59615.1 hypothetical protein ASD33_00385 [Streptomyces sp. Root1304]KRB00873.1 hypothetical protein ASE09_00385 [Streptomyces sp. Root66D1]
MTVTRPARLTGAALCAALALLSAVWILKDLAGLGSPSDLGWYWAGDPHFLLRGQSATSLTDPVLLAVSVATVVAALRSRHAASALAAAGAVTLALRLPGLWAPGSGALVTALLSLALAVGLLVTAAAGRRSGAAPYEPRPSSPRTGPAVAAGVLLAVAALVTVLWELYWATAMDLDITVDRFTGGRTVIKAALAPPPAWLSLVLVALYGTAAGSAFARARHTRAFGLLAGVFLAAGGLAGVARATRYEVIGDFGGLSTTDRLSLLTTCFGLLAGIAVLALLAGRGAPAPAAAPAPYPPAGMPPPAPPYPPPPGW